MSCGYYATYWQVRHPYVNNNEEDKEKETANSWKASAFCPLCIPSRCCAVWVYQSAGSRWPRNCRPGHVQLHWSNADFICLSEFELLYNAVLLRLSMCTPCLKRQKTESSAESGIKLKYTGKVVSHTGSTDSKFLFWLNYETYQQKEFVLIQPTPDIRHF